MKGVEAGARKVPDVPQSSYDGFFSGITVTAALLPFLFVVDSTFFNQDC